MSFRSPNQCKQYTMAAIAIVGGALVVGGAVVKGVGNAKTKKRLDGALKDDPVYQESPYAKQRLGLAQTILNARSPGAAAAERNIYQSGANNFARITRGATDSNQVIAAAAAAQGQEGEQFQALRQQEGQDYYNRLNNLNQAQEGAAAEQKVVFDDSVRRWQDRVNVILGKNVLNGQVAQSMVNAGGSMMSMGVGAKLGGGGGSNGSAGGYGNSPAVGGYGIGAGGTPSDIRLKENYHIVGKSPSGINIYEFSYKGDSKRFLGTMAQEVPQASFDMGNGYLGVNYSKIDVEFKQV